MKAVRIALALQIMVVGTGCDKTNRPSAAVDAGPTVATDAGQMVATDAGATAGDAGTVMADAGPVETDAGPPEMVMVSNVSVPCEPALNRGTTSPLLPDETGQLVGTRLTPAAYPFTVTEIAYIVGADTIAECNGGLAHRVEMIRSSGGDVPSNNPMADGVLIDVPADSTATAPSAREMTIELDTPIVLASGESLIVAIQLPGDGADPPATSLCIRTCAEPGSLAGVDYWSNATEAPYSWADLVVDFGFENNNYIYLRGDAPSHQVLGRTEPRAHPS